MAKFLAQKHLNSFRPVDDAGHEALRKIGQGEVIEIEFRRKRNIKHHRMFWALMTIVHDNMDHERYPTVEDLTAAVKIAAGLRTRIDLPNGEVGFIPGSIAFHKMDQTAFSEFYNRVSDLICKHFLPGVDSDALREEVEIMCGVRV